MPPRASVASSSSKRSANRSNQASTSSRAPNSDSNSNSAAAPSPQTASRRRNGRQPANATLKVQQGDVAEPRPTASASVRSPAIDGKMVGPQQSPRNLRHMHSFDLSESSSSVSSGDPEGDGSGKQVAKIARRLSDVSLGWAAKQGRAIEEDPSTIDANTLMESMVEQGTFRPILESFPLLDTITILLIILQLPSLVLTYAHLAFAIVTFGRIPAPTAGASGSINWTTVLLQGTNGGPSILTVILTDIIVALISMFLWPSARAHLIDFAQAVMAITIGAGNCSQSGALKNAAVCVGVMTGAKALTGSYDTESWPIPLRRTRSGQDFDSPSLFRSAIAIHIVAQGIMRATRAWLMKNPRFKNSSSSNRKKGESAQKQEEKEAEASVSSSAQATNGTPQVMDVKTWKKKQSTIARSSQPLWAMLANVLVYLTKFREEKQAQAEAMPDTLYALAYSRPEEDGFRGTIWLTDISSEGIVFEATQFGYRPPPESQQETETALVRGSRNEPAPFFVKVNKIEWPVRFTKSMETFDEEADDADWSRVDWTMHISGLAPATEYDIEFVWAENRSTIYKTSACTRQAEDSSNGAATIQSNPIRPLSPITTLENSLNQARLTRTEKNAKLRKTKKENTRRIAALRSEIDSNRARLGEDKSDERQRRKLLFLRESVRRAEEDVIQMQEQLDLLSTAPEEEQKAYLEKRKQWLEEKERLEEAEEAAEKQKIEAEKRIEAIENEISALTIKREKLKSRRGKLERDYERIRTEKASEADRVRAREKEKMASETEREYHRIIADMEKKTMNLRQRAGENWAMLTPDPSTTPSYRLPLGNMPFAHGSAGSLHTSPPPPPPGLPAPVNPIAGSLAPPNMGGPMPAPYGGAPFTGREHLASLSRQRSASFLTANEDFEPLPANATAPASATNGSIRKKGKEKEKVATKLSIEAA